MKRNVPLWQGLWLIINPLYRVLGGLNFRTRSMQSPTPRWPTSLDFNPRQRWNCLGSKSRTCKHHFPHGQAMSRSLGLKKEAVDKLKLTNHVSERHINIISDFNTIPTTYKQQRHCLLQMVEKHRKDYPSSKKKVLYS